MVPFLFLVELKLSRRKILLVQYRLAINFAYFLITLNKFLFRHHFLIKLCVIVLSLLFAPRLIIMESLAVLEEILFCLCLVRFCVLCFQIISLRIAIRRQIPLSMMCYYSFIFNKLIQFFLFCVSS